MNYLRNLFNYVCSNILLQAILVIIFLMPAVITFGQYISTDFINNTIKMNILFWPGFDKSVFIRIPVWTGIVGMTLLYLAGIAYMCKERVFAKAFIIAIIALQLSQLTGKGINYFTGWSELQNINSINLNGLVNEMIFAQWHNPFWEEIFFTGIPLLLFINLTKNKSDRIKQIGKILYFIIPSIICAIYHIPNHGLARVVDCFLLHVSFAYIALKYSFWAPLVIHCIFDNIIVISLNRINSISNKEIPWIINNVTIINTSFSITILVFFMVILILSVTYVLRFKKSNENKRLIA